MLATVRLLGLRARPEVKFLQHDVVGLGRDVERDVDAVGRAHDLELAGHGGWIRTLAFSPDGTLLASGAIDNAAGWFPCPTSSVSAPASPS